MSKLVEKMARAIAEKQYDLDWDELPQQDAPRLDRDDMREDAKASITTLREWLKENDLRIVPVEPTAEMFESAHAHIHGPRIAAVWQNMVQYAPDPLKDEGDQS